MARAAGRARTSGAGASGRTRGRRPRRSHPRAPGGLDVRGDWRTCTLPSTTVSRLLKSCATPLRAGRSPPSSATGGAAPRAAAARPRRRRAVDLERPARLLVPQRAAHRLDPGERAVLAPEADQDTHGSARRDRAPVRLDHRSPVFGVEERLALAADELLRLVAVERLRRRRRPQARAVERVPRDHVGRVLRQEAVLALADRSRALRRAAARGSRVGHLCACVTVGWMRWSLANWVERG